MTTIFIFTTQKKSLSNPRGLKQTMKEQCWMLVTWGSPERRKRSGHSGEVRPRCQSSSGRTEGSSGMTAPRSCRERRPPLGSGSSDPSRLWGRQQETERWTEKERRRREESRDSDGKGGRWVIQHYFLPSLILSFKNAYVWVCICTNLTCEPPLWLLSLHLEFPSWCSQP